MMFQRDLLPLKERFGAINRDVLIHLLGLVSALLYLILGELNKGDSSAFIWQFLTIVLALTLISWLAFRFVLSKTHVDQSRFPLASIVLWAVVFRMIGVVYDPILEDDFYRYLWDGYLFSIQGTPYGIAPSEFFGDETIPLSFQALLDGINYPDTPTIYGPVFQYSFLLGYILFPGDVLGLQLIYSLADILLIVLLANMISGSGVVPRAALLLYAWSPLIIKETAFTAHPDVLGVLFLMASLFALQKHNRFLAAIFLGLALSAKVFAILLAPLILLRCRPQHWLAFGLTVLLMYAPFLLLNTSDSEGLSAFANDWQFNGSVHALLVALNGWLGGAPWLPKLICAGLFCSFYLFYMLYYFKRTPHTIPRGDWIFGVFFLLAPVVNAWYLVWLLAFAVIYPSRWAWVASISVSLSYITGGSLGLDDMGLYQQPHWARVLEYGAIFIALFTEIWRKKPKFRHI